MPAPTIYSPEVATQVINALAAGRRPSSIAAALGVTRRTLYHWRSEDPDFYERWEQAVHAAGDRLEEILYEQAVNGDLEALRYWLRAYRPAIHDRAALIRLGMLQVTLTALAKKGGGADTAILELDQDGLPVISAANTESPSPNNLRPIHVSTFPHNNREELEPPQDDGSGRTLPLPARVVVIVDANGEVLSLRADSKPVPPGAVRSLWRRIVAYNELVMASSPPQQERRSAKGNGAAPSEPAQTEPMQVDPVQTEPAQAESTPPEAASPAAAPPPPETGEQAVETATGWDAGCALCEHQLPVLEKVAEPVIEAAMESVEAATEAAPASAGEAAPAPRATSPAPVPAASRRQPSSRDLARWLALSS